MTHPGAPDPVPEPEPEPDRRPFLQRLGDRPVPTAIAGVLLAAALGVAAATALQDDDDLAAAPLVVPTASPSPSPTPSPSPPLSATPSPTLSPSPAAPPSPVAWPDPSCGLDVATEAVCRFVLALQTGELEGLTDGERELASVETDLPDADFAVSSCELEGDVTVLCEVRFDDPEQIAAGFRLVPANGELDAESGQVIVAPGEQLRYEVVEAVGMRRDSPAPAAPPDPASPTAAPSPAAAGALVLSGDDLGVTRVGAPYQDAVRAVARVLGPPRAIPASSTACIGAEQLEVEWPGFRLAVSDDRVSGWTADDPRLRTPSGVAVGTTVAELRRTYGDRLRLFEPTPDAGPGFAVEGVELGGELGPSGRVTRLWNRACSPP